MTQVRNGKHGNLDNGHQRDEDQQYWRPRYMFHWLRAIGGSIDEAYNHFRDYKGKESHVQLGLEMPEHGKDEKDFEHG